MPQKSILKFFDKSLEARIRLTEEKKRIVEHTMFFDGTWSPSTKVSFHKDVIINSKDNTLHENKFEIKEFRLLRMTLLEKYPTDIKIDESFSLKVD
jgi:hypothetical protein